MRRELLVLEEMIEAANQAIELVRGITVQDLANDRMRRDALLWNMTVLGEAHVGYHASSRSSIRMCRGLNRWD